MWNYSFSLSKAITNIMWTANCELMFTGLARPQWVIQKIKEMTKDEILVSPVFFGQINSSLPSCNFISCFDSSLPVCRQVCGTVNWMNISFHTVHVLSCSLALQFGHRGWMMEVLASCTLEVAQNCKKHKKLWGCFKTETQEKNHRLMKHEHSRNWNVLLQTVV